MSFLDRVLDPPSYGFERDGALYVPTRRELLREFLSHINIFSSRKNWLPFFSWFSVLSLAIPLSIFFLHDFSWPLFALAFVYSMVVMGTHGTIYLHRYSTHRAYRFSHPFARFICRNLTIKIIPEEVYVLSHHVHHAMSEQPGDPYNVHGGWLYCFLADANHQNIRKDLTPEEYGRVCKLMDHTGVHLNSYEQYQRWGTISHPAWTIAHYVLNWGFWYAIFFLIGGHTLAVTLFGAAGVWGIGVRTYNYEGHGGGKDKRREGSDFHRKDLSINQLWPGYVAGEWHNNHHLFPNGARSGFLPHQLDLAWVFIWFYHKVGGISSYRDFKDQFMSEHYLPYLAKTQAQAEAPAHR